jgi:DNA-binding transcriptional regulator GbsR (MarR family)
MGRFTADPGTLSPEGKKMVNISEQMTERIDSVYNTIDDMTAKDYLSPEAKEIANRIEEKRKELEEIKDIVNQYGNFAQGAAVDVINNQEEISSEIDV